MPACASVVALSRVAIEPGSSPYTFDSSSEQYDFNGSTMQIHDSIVFSDTIRGTRSQAVEQTRQGPTWVGGVLSLPVNVASMDLWLPRILGGTESADVFPVAETLPSFGLLADLVGNTHEFKDLYVNEAVFSGQAWDGQSTPRPIRLDMSIVGKSEATGTTFPSVSISTAANAVPLIFEEGAFTLAGAARNILQFRLSIKNMLRVRYSNSLTPTCIYSGGRLVTLSVLTPYIANDEATGSNPLYGQAYTGASATILFTNGNTSFGFTLGRFQAPRITPHATGKGEILLRTSGVARSVTTTKEIVGANDSTV